MNRINTHENASLETETATASALSSLTVQRLQAARAFPLPKSLMLLLAVFLGFCALHTFAIVTPTVPREYPTYWVMPRAEQYHADEPRHVAQIDYMANYHRLPPFETHKDMQLYADSYHPPCYYTLCAIIWAVAHPLLGRHATILLLRLLSGLMGAGIVYYTYRTARLLTTKEVALLAAACVAGVPMFVDVAASVSNEILSAFAASVSLYYLALGMKRGFGWRETLWMSLWIAIGICSKYTCAGIIPAAWLGLWWTGRQRRQTAAVTLQMMSVVAGLSVLSVGWFLVRNVMLYGDLFRLKVWENYWPSMDGYKERHAQTHVSWKGYAHEITNFGWMSFWGCFDRVYKTMPARLYTFLRVLNFLTLAGTALLYLRGWFGGLRGRVFLAFCMMTLVLLYQFYKFNWWHFSAQGRYFFPLMVPYGILTAAGWLALFPRRLKRAASLTLMSCLLVLNIYVYRTYPLHPVTVEVLPPLYARHILPTDGHSHIRVAFLFAGTASH